MSEVARDWRWAVANLSPQRWSRWRALSGEMLGGLDREPTAEDIKGCDRAAFDLVKAEGGTD